MIVVDASAAITVVREGQDSPFYSFLAESNQKTIAPEFFGLETAQVAWKYAHVGLLDEAGAVLMHQDAVNIVNEFLDDSQLAAEALTEAIRFNHSFYDMLYFVLARRTASPLLTCDHRLAALCKQADVECVELTEL